MVIVLVFGKKPGARVTISTLPGSMGSSVPQPPDPSATPLRKDLQVLHAREVGDDDGEEGQIGLELGDVLFGELFAVGAVGFARVGKRLTKLAPCARDATFGFVADREIEERAGRGVEPIALRRASRTLRGSDRPP